MQDACRLVGAFLLCYVTWHWENGQFGETKIGQQTIRAHKTVLSVNGHDKQVISHSMSNKELKMYNLLLVMIASNQFKISWFFCLS